MPHEFECCRYDPVFDDFGNGFSCIFKPIEGNQQIHSVSWKREKSKKDLDYYAEGSFRPQHKLKKIITGHIFYDLSSHADDLS